jgi:hypothetical protein
MPITIDDVVTEIDDADDQGGAEAALTQAQISSIASSAAELVAENDDIIERIAELVLQRLHERGQVD